MKTCLCTRKNGIRFPMTQVNNVGNAGPAEMQMLWSSHCIDTKGNKGELTRRENEHSSAWEYVAQYIREEPHRHSAPHLDHG